MGKVTGAQALEDLAQKLEALETGFSEKVNELSQRTENLEKKLTSQNAPLSEGSTKDKGLRDKPYNQMTGEERKAFLVDLFSGDLGAEAFTALGAELGFDQLFEGAREGDLIISRRDHSGEEGWVYSEKMGAWLCKVPEGS